MIRSKTIKCELRDYGQNQPNKRHNYFLTTIKENGTERVQRAISVKEVPHGYVIMDEGYVPTAVDCSDNLEQANILAREHALQVSNAQAKARGVPLEVLIEGKED